ncbi:hypothetical protein ASPNIDRAFT_42414 [Aspergillus niger ATCC 1015]|uniref:Heterokaryon incompatibility domain-containing protein n=2 Tax=Aspergillus niger TaxID=5061 RepID=G3XVH3_ASPNA|nr:hypothetical protein ASPNIDRAFT_42414 [Aspergillus niger ATCC 1015]TPR06037.1 Heterokaryon incompatibility protein (HET) family protein [Aspergillus niger]SPB46133.1 unnamed protein product [Aspergillus niger]
MQDIYIRRYGYSRLTEEGEIRLLKIYPEMDGDGEICCDIFNIRLKDRPSYIALSYTWGAPTPEASVKGVTSIPNHHVKCNGDVIHITKNLHDFLNRVRSDRKLCPRSFWIDSVCINQEDELERASQVAFMASIYRSADMVISWLGEQDAHTEDAFSLIRFLGKTTVLENATINDTASGDSVDLCGQLLEAPEWISLGKFWERTYFTRAWVIQEIALARGIMVMCGGYTVDWDHIVQVSRYLTLMPWKWASHMKSSIRKDGIEASHSMPLYLNSNRKMVFSKKQNSLLHILIKSRRFRCLDPRDKVYALLGLLGDRARGERHLYPIYKDRSVSKVYISTAIYILEETDDLLLLAHAEGKDFRNIRDLPSWVPDWSCQRGLGLGITGYSRFTAAGTLKRFLQINEAKSHLTVRGLWLDRVAQVGESKDEAIKFKDLAYFPGWLSILLALPLKYHTGQPRAEVFWRTLITDTAARVPQPAHHPAPDEFGCAFRKWIIRIVSEWSNKPLSTEKTDFLDQLYQLFNSDETSHFQYAVGKQGNGPENNGDISPVHTGNSYAPYGDAYEVHVNYSSQTRLIRTDSNYLGLATTSIKEGDSIWIVAGSRVPLVLREADERGVYRVVGGAYVHGFMQGEALNLGGEFTFIKIV